MKNKDHVLLLFAGVIYYFDENNVMRLFDEFGQQFKYSTLLLDYSSKKGVRIESKKVIERGGMSQNANLLWGIDNIYEIEKWNRKTRVIENIPMFKFHKKNYPIMKRIGMNISDILRLMSLTHIQIGV